MMASTDQKYRTWYARATVNLKKGIVENRTKMIKKGKTRGKYNTKKNTKRKDEIEYFSSIFESTETVDGEDFLLLVGGGRIQSKYQDHFLFVKTGRVPDEWAKGLADPQLLSDAKVEQAKHATH